MSIFGFLFIYCYFVYCGVYYYFNLLSLITFCILSMMAMFFVLVTSELGSFLSLRNAVLLLFIVIKLT